MSEPPATPAPPGAAPSAGARTAAAVQLLALALVAIGGAAAAGVPLPMDGRATGSLLLLAMVALFAVAAWRRGRDERGPRRYLFLLLAAAAACAALAQLHDVVRYVLLGQPRAFPSPALLLMLLGTQPLLLVALGGALVWRRDAVRTDAALDAVLLGTAAAIVGLQLNFLLMPAPAATAPDEWRRALHLLERGLPIAILGLTVLLVALRGAMLGGATAAALAAGMVAFAVGSLFHEQLGRLDRGPAVDVTDLVLTLSTLAFATALRGRAGVADVAPPAGTFTASDGGVRARFVIGATLIAAQATLMLGTIRERSLPLAAALALFTALLAVRGLRELRRQRRQADALAASIVAERTLSQTLEQRVSERTGALAEAQRVLQRMWVLGQQVTQEPRPTLVVQRFLEAVRDVARVDSVVLGLIADEQSLRITAALGDGERVVGQLLPMEGSAMGYVVRVGHSWQLADLRAPVEGDVSPRVLHAVSARLGRPPTGGVAVVPVQRRGRPLGALALLSDEPRVWSGEELARVEAMTDLLSVALANAETVESLRQAEWRFRTLFRAAPDAVLTLRADGHLHEANDYASDLFALTPDELAGRELGALVLDGDRDALAAAVAEGARGQPARVDVRVPRPDGSVRHVEIALTRLPEGEPAALLLIGRDVTHEHDMHARLVEAERLAAIGELVAGVAHEVNNPLSSISAFAQLLLRDENLTDEQHESVEVVHAEAMRASQVVKDLLAFARRSDPRREPVELTHVVERALRLRGYQLASHNVRTELALDAGLPAVHGDARQLQQVVLNLVTNALQAMPDGGVLRVASRCHGESVELSIGDSGGGIPAEARPHIFEPFFTTKPEGEGTGLGLSVSYGIAAAHGGTLALAESSAAGTRFVLTLPAAPAGDGEADEPLPAPSGARRSALAGTRLLFVDDEPALRRSLLSFGRLRGIEIVTAASGHEALAAVESAGFDAVICDLRMPGMDGVAVYEALRERRPGLASRMLLITGDMLSGAMRFRGGQGPATLAKPFSFEQLEEAVLAVLHGASVPARPR